MNPLGYEPRGLEALDANGPQLLFAEHHRSLRQAGEDLTACAHEDDRFSLVAGFRTFEKQVLEHMRAEEEIVLLGYAEEFPSEAAAIQEEHQMIRKQLERTALDVELHSIRIKAIRDLLGVLDDHARNEDRTMYPWTQVHLPATSRIALGTRLLASIRLLAQIATR